MIKENKIKWWMWLLLGCAFIIIAFISWNDGFNDGYNNASEIYFEKGINWSIEWTHDNCINYLCNLENTNCFDEKVKIATDNQCYDIIGGKK